MKPLRLLSISLLLLVSGACQHTDNARAAENQAGTAANTPPVAPTAPTAQIAQPAPAYTPSTEEIVAAIRKEFHRINSSKLTSKTFSWENSGCGHGTLTYFLLNNEIVKTVEHGSADGFWTKESYYQHGKFIFQYLHEESHPIAGPDSEILELRTYVHNDRVVRYMADTDIVPCVTCSYGPNSSEYLLLDAYETGNIDDAICRW